MEQPPSTGAGDSAARAPRARSETLASIVDFLTGIGIPVRTACIARDTVLPGIDIEHGALVYDPQRLEHPGDLLHEAGHLAVATPRERAQSHGEVALDAGAELAAIAWSWAAREHLGLDPQVVFHAGGYKGEAQSIIQNFTAGHYFGVPLLQLYGIAAEPQHARRLGMPAFPRVARWLRDDDPERGDLRPAAGESFPSRARLPLEFDVDALVADLEGLRDADWVSHFNEQQYRGRWQVASLRATAHASHPLLQAHPDPAAGDWADTPLMDRCPALRAAVASLECIVNSTRLLALGPGSRILEHRDHALGLADGVARLHLPVTTGPDVAFLLAGQRVDMHPGELWYLDFNLPHAVHNAGERERVHLVMDCVANDWLRRQVARSPSALSSAAHDRQGTRG